MADKGNVKDFLAALGSRFSQTEILEYAEESPDRIYHRRFNTSAFVTDYSHAVVEYLRASGCKILHWSWSNWNSNLMVNYTRPTLWVDPEIWFNQVYQGGRLVSTSEKILVGSVILSIIVLILIARWSV